MNRTFLKVLCFSLISFFPFLGEQAFGGNYASKLCQLTSCGSAQVGDDTVSDRPGFFYHLPSDLKLAVYDYLTLEEFDELYRDQLRGSDFLSNQETPGLSALYVGSLLCSIAFRKLA